MGKRKRETERERAPVSENTNFPKAA
jgi:hypothetical protein